MNATARLLLTLALAATAGCGPAPAQSIQTGGATSSGSSAPTNGRLPSDVVPLGYALEMRIVPNEPTFAGRVQIHVRLGQAREVIWLHGKNLSIQQVEVALDGAAPLPGRFEQTDDDGTARITLPQPIGPGSATIRIAWTAPYRSDDEGLFHVEASGNDYAFTQMEPLGARTVFPCFDEPGIKVPFEVSLTVPETASAIANTAQTGETTGGGTKTVRFATTRPLPTYLIAWAVGPLDVVEAPPIPPNAVRRTPLPFRGVAVAGRGAELAHALESTPEILALLEEYFGISYPYDKLDIIAIPGFDGAMENAGAVTFADTILLLDPATAPTEQKRWFGYTVMHELSHMWFGDLVTMAWWDDLWLNEAMASWMETKLTGRWQPDWHTDRDQEEQVLEAMDVDSLASARYIRQPIGSTHDIHNAFDWITYTKGMAVLSMFEQWLGERDFQRAIQSYLSARPFGTATAADLASALSEAAHRDLTPALQSFLLQSGIPTIDARLECAADGAATVSLAQSRYVPVGSTASPDRSWNVPVCIAYGADHTRAKTCLLLSDRTGTVPLPGGSCPEWILPNAGATGYYRWTLPPEQLAALRDHALGELTVPERMSLADSVEAAFDAGRAPAADVLAALAPLARDDARHVAVMPMSLVRFVSDYVVADDARPKLQRWARGLYADRLTRLGFQPRAHEPDDDGVLRAEVIGFLARVAMDPAVRRQAAQRARRYLGMGRDDAIHADAVAPDLVGTVLRVAAEDGDAALFDAMLARLGGSEDGILRMNLLIALGSFREPELAARARELTLDPSVRNDERFLALHAQMDDARTRDDAWRFLTERYDEIAAMAGASIWTANLPGLAEPFCTVARADEVQAFFAPRVEHLPGGPRDLASAVETIRLCAARADAQRESVAAFFAAMR